MSRDEQQVRWGRQMLEWLDEKWPQPRACPVCRSTDAGWDLGHIGEIRVFTGGGLVLGSGSRIYPMAPVMCKNCGYTFLVNAAHAGIVQPPKPEAAEPEAGQ